MSHFPVFARLQFLPGWTVRVSGMPVQGESFAVLYHPDRYLEYAGLPFGSLEARILYHPSGIVNVHPLLHTTDLGISFFEERLWIPRGSHHLELWFCLTDGEGRVYWDSDFGRNFHLDVAGQASSGPNSDSAESFRYSADGKILRQSSDLRDVYDSTDETKYFYDDTGKLVKKEYWIHAWALSSHELIREEFPDSESTGFPETG